MRSIPLRPRLRWSGAELQADHADQDEGDGGDPRRSKAFAQGKNAREGDRGRAEAHPNRIGRADGQVFMAKERRPRPATEETKARTVGQNRVNPCASFSAKANTGSNKTAIRTASQALTR